MTKLEKLRLFTKPSRFTFNKIFPRGVPKYLLFTKWKNRMAARRWEQINLFERISVRMSNPFKSMEAATGFEPVAAQSSKCRRQYLNDLNLTRKPGRELP
jgi:hypothetical protein